MPNIDRQGTFIGAVVESAYSTTSTGLPQWTARLKATKYWASAPDDLKHFGIEHPGYVAWDFDEAIVAYMVLFSADAKPFLNYEQIQKATGWDGQDFQTLGDLAGKELLFRVEENTYNNQTRLQVSWVDAADAPPERQLRAAAPEKAKADTAKFLAGLKKASPPVPVAAKPVAAKPPAVPTTAAGATVPAASTPTAPAVASTAAESPKPPSRRPKSTTAAPSTPPAAPATVAPAALPASPANSLPSEITMADAWAYVNTPAVKGDNGDNVVEEAWISAAAEVGATPETDATAPLAIWAKIRDVVVKDLGAK